MNKIITKRETESINSEFDEFLPGSITPGMNVWQRFRRYSGIGFLVAVGYMDPGNWATDIEAGSRYGYNLLCVILLASMVAMLLQTLCVRMGIASGRDLAQLCRERFHPKINFMLWLFAEVAIIACDFAEVLGTALALKLLFGLQMEIGIILTAFDTLLVLFLQGRGFLKVESFIIALVVIIAAAFAIEIYIVSPDWDAVAGGFIPDLGIFNEIEAWMLAVGIFGATVMPHNLYLHSAAVNSRNIHPGKKAEKDAIRLLTYDILITLGIAFFINAAILILAAAAFHYSGYPDVKEIDQAYYLLAPLLGTGAASILFGIALFASGQSSTITGTIAGQVIFQGFLNIKLPRWKQRLITRLLAIIPALIGIMILGEGGVGKLLVISQIVLSMQLPFAIIPLIMFNNDKEIMGRWKISRKLYYICWLICGAIISANILLLWHIIT